MRVTGGPEDGWQVLKIVPLRQGFTLNSFIEKLNASCVLLLSGLSVGEMVQANRQLTQGNRFQRTATESV